MGQKFEVNKLLQDFQQSLKNKQKILFNELTEKEKDDLY